MTATRVPPHLNAALAGRYEIVREIGAGGMATVYLARDLKHDRLVAIKALDPELSATLGAERFLAEIRVTANLHHPNILPLYDSGDADGLLFYVMPFVAGESLRARIERERQLPADEAVRIAVAVARAIDYAHEQGVVHRDLKPENILLAGAEPGDGARVSGAGAWPLVADFGIALAVRTAGGGGARLTHTGLSLGTPTYMSPEQAAGERHVDGRTDVYSLGAVLYEMLAGQPPFAAPTVQAVIAKIITERPTPLRTLRDAVPEHVTAAVERALAKVPADRWSTAGEFADALESRPAAWGAPPERQDRADAAAGPHRTVAGRAIPARAWRVRAAVFAAAGLGIAGVSAAIAWTTARSHGSPPARRARFEITLSDSAPLRSDRNGPVLAVSPDGSRLVYNGGVGRTRRLYVRALDDLEPTPIRGTDGGFKPSFTPDGASVLFLQGRRLMRVPVAGGEPVPVAESVFNYSWGDGDVVVATRERDSLNGLWLLTPGRGAPRRLAAPDRARGETNYEWPFVLPGSRAALFVITRGSIERSEVALVTIPNGKVTRLGIEGVNPRYMSTGHLIVGRLEGSIVAVPFDLGRLRPTGTPVTVLDGVVVKSGGAMEAAFASDVMAYVRGSLGRRLFVVDRAGHATPLLDAVQHYRTARFSPDGRRVAIEIWQPGGADIWVRDIAAGTLTRFTHDGRNYRPAWSADGRRLAWVHDDGTASTIQWQPVDESAPAVSVAGTERYIGDVTLAPDGRTIAYTVLPPTDTTGHVVIARVDSSAHPRADSAAARTIPFALAPVISPDGKWLAYTDTETGGFDVYVRPLEGPGGRTQISTDGGEEAAWSRDSKVLYYRDLKSARIIAATLSAAPTLAVARRDTLFQDTYLRHAAYRLFDAAPSGDQFLLTQVASSERRLMVVLGWPDELRERLGAKK